MAPNHGGEPLGYILGPMGSHWGQKNGSKPSKITMSQNSNFWLLRGNRFGQKIDFTVMAPYHGGDPLGSILGPMGSHWGQKMGQNRKKIIMTQNSNFWLLRGHRFEQNIEYTVMGPNHGGDPLGSILVPMGSHWGKKMGQNRKKLPCPKIRFVYSYEVIDLGKKSNFTVMAPSHGGDPLGSILGPMGSHWGIKMGQSCKKLPCPKIRIFDYSPVIDLGKKSNLRLWREITMGTP